jgi:large subunit ribosomal protein L31
MKTEIHPKYFENVKITCQSCGTVFLAGSTTENLKTEICSACHPFYTGKRRIVDAEGRADKFLKKIEKAKAVSKAKKAVKTEEELENEEITEEVKVEAAPTEEIAKPKTKAKKTAKSKSPAAKVKKAVKAPEKKE